MLERIYAERLFRLADYMENLVVPDFTMSRFFNGCGTPACALGYASTIPEFQELGLTKAMLYGRNDNVALVRDQIFGVYKDLFDSELQYSIKTPQQWAAHCRTYLASQGWPNPPYDGDKKVEWSECEWKPLTAKDYLPLVQT